MNFLDKAISIVSPSWAASRLRDKLLIEQFKNYDATKPGRTRKTKIRNVSGDTAIHGHAESIRGQARYLDESHDIVTGLLNTLEQKVVGPKGINIEPMPYTVTGEKAEDLAWQITKLFEKFSIAPDTTGEYSREEMERLVCRSWLRDGEVFGKHVLGNVANYRHNTIVPMSVELLESDFLPYHKTDLGKGVFQGIERNNWGQPLAYHFYKHHPGDMRGFNSSTIRVSSDFVQHLKYTNRLRQGRGISILHSVITRLEDLKDYEESERVAARISAILAAYIKKNGGPGGMPNQEGDRVIPMAPGAFFDGLMPGEDVGTIQSNRPSTLLQPFRDAMLRAVAKGTRGTHSTISGQFDGNYSSQRQEMVEGYAGYETLQRIFITKWSKPFYRKFIDIAILSGLLDVPADVDMDSIYNAFYFGPVMPWIDPQKEMTANEKGIRAGVTTEAEVIRSKGKNPQEVKNQRAAEVKRNAELDLVFSSDARHELRPQEPPTQNNE